MFGASPILQFCASCYFLLRHSFQLWQKTYASGFAQAVG